MPRFGRKECDRGHNGAVCRAGDGPIQADGLTRCRAKEPGGMPGRLLLRGCGCRDNRCAIEEARMPSEYDFLLPYVRAARRTGRGLMLAAAFALGIGCAALVIALPLQQVLPDKKAAVTEGRVGKTAET